MYVCLCRGITDQDIKNSIASGSETFRDIREELDVGTCCGRCVPEARQLINEELGRIAAKIAVAA